MGGGERVRWTLANFCAIMVYLWPVGVSTATEEHASAIPANSLSNKSAGVLVRLAAKLA